MPIPPGVDLTLNLHYPPALMTLAARTVSDLRLQEALTFTDRMGAWTLLLLGLLLLFGPGAT